MAAIRECVRRVSAKDVSICSQVGHDAGNNPFNCNRAEMDPHSRQRNNSLPITWDTESSTMVVSRTLVTAIIRYQIHVLPMDLRRANGI